MSLGAESFLVQSVSAVVKQPKFDKWLEDKGRVVTDIALGKLVRFFAAPVLPPEEPPGEESKVLSVVMEPFARGAVAQIKKRIGSLPVFLGIAAAALAGGGLLVGLLLGRRSTRAVGGVGDAPRRMRFRLLKPTPRKRGSSLRLRGVR